MNTFSKMLLAAGLCGIAQAASAATIQTTVDGRSGPWDQSVNPTLSYDKAALGPTVIASPTGSLAAGTAYTISFSGGETQTVSFYSQTDGRGYSNIQGGIGYPSQYVAYAPGEVSYLQELMGAFADSTGKVVGNPFLVGNYASVIAPVGASEILLGINDNHYADNLGALTVAVSGANLSTVPLPASAPMFGAALLGLAGLGYAAKRKKASAAA